jgi:hypothetical protein
LFRHRIACAVGKIGEHLSHENLGFHFIAFSLPEENIFPMEQIDPEATVLKWLAVIGFGLVVVWLSVSFWKTTKECQQKCIDQGFEQSHIQLKSIARGIVGSCTCEKPKP